MRYRNLTTTSAAIASVLVGTAWLAMPAATATAASAGRPLTAAPPAHRAISAPDLGSLRRRQRELAARPAPAFDKSASRTFTVTTTEDAALANPAETHCVDLVSGRCSLRAAVEAANNLSVPVRIVLGSHTYPLTTLTAMTVTNPRGVFVVGQGASRTAIAGVGSGLFVVTTGAGADAAGQLFVSSVKLRNGTASEGGAVFVDSTGATLSLDHVVATHNVATDRGGAVFAADYNGVFVSHSRFTANHAVYGGAVFAYWADLQIASSTFVRNSTLAGGSGEGGAIYTEFGVVRVVGGSISGNAAGDATERGDGGGISDYYGNVALTGVHVDHNTASGGGVGGAVHAYSDLLRVDRGTMSHNRVTGFGSGGGAVFAEVNANLEFHGATLIDNTAGSPAEAGLGGAVALTTAATLSDTGSTFAENRAFGDGAAGGAVFNASEQSARFVGSRFTANRAGPRTGGDGRGGAVATSDESGTAFAKVTMTGNVAASYGGAVYGDGLEFSTSIERSTFSGNRAGNAGSAGYGGALFMSDAVLSVQNSTFTGNRALSVSGAPGQGGAIWHGGARLGLHYSTVSGNYAARGAGIYSEAEGGSLLASIVSRNRTSPTGSEQDCAVTAGYAALNSLGGNVLGQGRCVTGLNASDKVTRRLHLGKLRDNGGPTRTMAISAKSPAVGRASYLVPATDQRGHRRPTRHADAGAFELPPR
jgi:CSLREA domain-containing protein